jgi:hypothetical protein
VLKFPYSADFFAIARLWRLGTPAACLVAWTAGSAPRGGDGSGVRHLFVGRKESQAPSPRPIGATSNRQVVSARCRARHAPVSARVPLGSVVGWGWPHRQSCAGSRRAHLPERRSPGRPRRGVERHSCVEETEGGASPTLRASKDACPHNHRSHFFGWMRRQVMARTSSKSCKAVVAFPRCEE